MVTAGVTVLLALLHYLLNLVVKTERFPNRWTEELLVPIFKSGKSNDPQNYWGTTLKTV